MVAFVTSAGCSGSSCVRRTEKKAHVREAGVATRPASYACRREIHVSPSGNDAADGTAGGPMKTIAKASRLAGAGDCVAVHRGRYEEPATIAFSNDGTPEAPIVLWSADGRNAAVIDARSNRRGPTVLVENDYVIVDGFEFQNSPIDTREQVVHFDGLGRGKGVGSVLRNCRITGGFDHVKVNRASSGVTIENNELYGTFGHLGVSLTGANRLVFRNNFAHDWRSGRDSPIQIKGGSRDSVFDANRFEDIDSTAGTIALGDSCDATCDMDPDHYAAVHVRATNNVMIRVGRGFDLHGCNACAVLSNTIVDSGTRDAIFTLGAATTNGVVRETTRTRILDNLIANPDGDLASVVLVGGASGASLEMDYNLVWNGGRRVAWGKGHPEGADRHSITIDPGLSSRDDPSLRDGSAATGAGINIAGDVPHDFAGLERRPDGPFDIGAYRAR